MAHQKLPIGDKQYEQLLRSMPKADAKELNEQLNYLRSHFGNNAIDPYVKDSKYVYFHFDFLEEEHETGTARHQYISNSCNTYSLNIPEGYNKLVKVYTNPVYCKKGQKVVKMRTALDGQTIGTVLVNLDTLKAHSNRMDTPILLPCTKDSLLYAATAFSISGWGKDSCNVDVTGFILQKK